VSFNFFRKRADVFGLVRASFLCAVGMFFFVSDIAKYLRLLASPFYPLLFKVALCLERLFVLFKATLYS